MMLQYIQIVKKDHQQVLLKVVNIMGGLGVVLMEVLQELQEKVGKPEEGGRVHTEQQVSCSDDGITASDCVGGVSSENLRRVLIHETLHKIVPNSQGHPDGYRDRVSEEVEKFENCESNNDEPLTVSNENVSPIDNNINNDESHPFISDAEINNYEPLPIINEEISSMDNSHPYAEWFDISYNGEFDFLSNSDTEEFSEDDLPLAKTYPLE